MEVILPKWFSLSLLHKDKDVEGIGSSNGGVVIIAAKARRSHILAVIGGNWTTLSRGIGAWKGLKLSEEDGIEVEGVSDALEVATLVDRVADNPES